MANESNLIWTLEQTGLMLLLCFSVVWLVREIRNFFKR